MNDPVIPTSVRKPSNPKDDAAAGTRVDMSVIPDTALVYLALAMTEGHLKYGAFNYRVVGVKASVYIAAFRRHWMKWINGQWADEKTNIPHLASCMACIAILIDAHECGKLIDDRPPAVKAIDGDISALFDWAEVITTHLHKLFPPEEGPGRYTEEGQREKETNGASGSVYDSAGSGGSLPRSSSS